MENNIFLIGKFSGMPFVERNSGTARVFFTVTENETGKKYPVIAETSEDFSDRVKDGKDVEIIGTSFTKKVRTRGKVKCLRVIKAHSISTEE